MHCVDSAELATRLGAPHLTQKTSRLDLGARAAVRASVLALSLKYFPHERQLVEMTPSGSLWVPWQCGHVTSWRAGFFMRLFSTEDRLQLLESARPETFRRLPSRLGRANTRLRFRADLDPRLDEIARLQDQRTGVDRSHRLAPGCDGQAAERFEIAIESPREHDVLHHAQAALQHDSGMNF